MDNHLVSSSTNNTTTSTLANGLNIQQILNVNSRKIDKFNCVHSYDSPECFLLAVVTFNFFKRLNFLTYFMLLF